MTYVRFEMLALVPSAALSASKVPDYSATWNEITRFAYTFDGYRVYGDDVGDMANRTRDGFIETQLIDARLDLDALRGCLFFEARRYAHFGYVPEEEDAPYLRALLHRIAEQAAERSAWR